MSERLTAEQLPKKGDFVFLPGRGREYKIARVADDTISVYGMDRGRRRIMSLCSFRGWAYLVSEGVSLRCD